MKYIAAHDSSCALRSAKRTRSACAIANESSPLMKVARTDTYSYSKDAYSIAINDAACARSETPALICSETMACVAMKTVVRGEANVSSCSSR